IESHVGRLIKVENIVARRPHSAQRQQHATIGAKFQNYVRTDVSGPNVVFRIHPHGVGGNEEIIGDAAKKFPVSIKLHQRMFAAMKYVDVTFGIHCYSSDLNEMLVGRQLKETGNGFAIELWSGFLSASMKDRSCEKQNQDPQQITAHLIIHRL